MHTAPTNQRITQASKSDNNETPGSLKILHWNCKGWSNLTNLPNEDLQIILSHDVITLNETWLTQEVKNQTFHNFKIIFSNAIKEKSRGRASGGIAIMIKNSLLSKMKQIHTLDISDMWIFVELQGQFSNLIIGAIYINSSRDSYVSVELLEATMNDIMERSPDSHIIALGDFNAWVGNLNQLNYTDEELLAGTKLTVNRETTDGKINKRGKLITATMESANMLLMNGRTISDSPAQYTFVGNPGKSIIDLAWISVKSAEFINDFKVIPNFPVSDHFPCSLTLMSNLVSLADNNGRKSPVSGKEVTIFKWNNDLSKNFNSRLASSLAETEEKENREIDDYNTLLTAIKKSASETGLSHTVKRKISSNMHRNNWFDQECRIQKRKVKKAARQARREKFSNNSCKNLLFEKEMYSSLIKRKKKANANEIQNAVANTKNPSEFWKTIKKLRCNKTQKSSVDTQTWEKYLENFYETIPEADTVFQDARHPVLDRKIETKELNSVLDSLKNNKTPGTDSIPYEFYKNLNGKGKSALLRILNNVMEKGEIPKKWGEIKLSMLYKKGDPNDPDNYRGIALINSLAKILTYLVTKRVTKFIEINNLLPENQAGFREKRGCNDNIFVLNSIIQFQKLKKQKAYLIFVDFKKAFDSVNHQKLWIKLYNLGVTANLIKIVQNLYKIANVMVDVNGMLSKPVKVSKGVLQGDPFSALAFILFISDIETVLRKHVRGINVTISTDILLLAYADDLVILAESPIDAQRKLNYLEKYCLENDLIVNVSKTKILPCHCGRKPGKLPRFKYGGEEIEVVKHYVYLGVKFTSSGLFAMQADDAISRTAIAGSSVIQILQKAKNNSFKSVLKLWDSVTLATLLYAAEIWALRYCDMLESAQSRFFKSVFRWQRCTPHYVIRQETGKDNIETKVLKSTLNWYHRVQNMHESRYPKICLARLKELDESRYNIIKYNWFSQLKAMLHKIDQEYLSLRETTEPAAIRKMVNEVQRKISELTMEKDKEKLNETKFVPHYNLINTENIDANHNYLYRKVSFAKKRLFSQLRARNVNSLNITINQMNHRINPNEICTICNTQQPEDAHHLFFVCPIYHNTRKYYLHSYLNKDINLILSKDSNEQQLTDIYNYFATILSIRSFIINE